MAKQNVLQKSVKPYEYKGRMRKKTRLTSRGTRSWGIVRGRLTPHLFKEIKSVGLTIDEIYFGYRKKNNPRHTRWLTENDIQCVARGHGFDVDNTNIIPTAESKKRKRWYNELQRPTPDSGE